MWKMMSIFRPKSPSYPYFSFLFCCLYVTQQREEKGKLNNWKKKNTVSFQQPHTTKLSTHGTFSVLFLLFFRKNADIFCLKKIAFPFSTFYPFWERVVFNRDRREGKRKKCCVIRKILLSTVSTGPITASTKSFFHSFVHGACAWGK